MAAAAEEGWEPAEASVAAGWTVADACGEVSASRVAAKGFPLDWAVSLTGGSDMLVGVPPGAAQVEAVCRWPNLVCGPKFIPRTLLG